MPANLAVVNGQLGLFGSRTQVADAGNYYVATNPSPGTGVQSGLIAAFSATADGHCVIANNNPTTSGILVYPDYLKFLMSGTAPATTTVMHFAAYTDVVASAIPSAGSVAYTPVNVNANSANVSAATVYVPTGGAALTIPAASASRRLVGRASIATSLGITGDEYLLQFGGNFSDVGGQGGGTAVRSTAAAKFSAFTSPVILGPGQALIVLMWWLTATTTAPTFEWEVGLAAR